MTEYNIFTLTNGLRVIHIPNSSDVAYCGFAIDAGTRDESDKQEGMAHFVEHTIFKGTSKRRAWHILNRMERVGGELNAYTNKEETVVYSSFLKEDFYRAAELLTDIVFNSTFPQSEIDKEVEVILDEIQSYKDDPSELILDDFEEILFPNHPLGKNILGKAEYLKSFQTKDALEFTSKFYRTTNMIFFIQGNIEVRKVKKVIEKLTCDIPMLHTEKNRIAPLPYIPEKRIICKDTHQAHIMIGSRGYGAHNDKRTALYLLNNILGGPGMNSRLNVSLREKRGLVYNVEANLTSYTDTGVFCIYFGCDTKDIDKCISITEKELKRLRDNKFTTSQLDSAKKQIIGQIGVASDNFENNALDISKSFLHYNKVEQHKDIFRRIESITSDTLLEVANEMFTPDYLSTLIYK